ncbi:uncharacterized protein PFLUO_LOCUS2632 [Penicillium psychrofluorescens]|uniref:uncharacterized protein n=1 Tax=Penicillium psychrofluorescens TaxID=3158075 RepID=UPI003CCCFB37
MSGSSLEITLPGSQLHQTVLLDRIDPSVGLVRRFEIELLAFDHLEEVSMLYHDPEILIPRHVDARNTDDVLSLFYLPSIKSITATMDNPIVFAWPGENPPNPSSLTSLNLEMAREEPLRRISSVTTNLQRLEWFWFYREDRRDQFVTNTIDFDKIFKALSPVHETLTDLTVSAAADIVRAPELPQLNLAGPFKAFRDLDKLERLEVPLPFLAGFSLSDLAGTRLEAALPKNVEWVTITDDMFLQEQYRWKDTELLECLRQWFHDRASSTPRLQGFHLLLKEIDYEDWGPAMRKALVDLGSREGICIEVTKLAGEM